MDYLYSFGNTFGKNPMAPTRIEFLSKSKIFHYETNKYNTLILTYQGELFYKTEIRKEYFHTFQLIFKEVELVSNSKNYFIFLKSDKLFLVGNHPFFPETWYGKENIDIGIKDKIKILQVTKRLVYISTIKGDLFIYGVEKLFKKFKIGKQLEPNLFLIQNQELNINDEIRKLSSGDYHIVFLTRKGKVFILGDIYDRETQKEFLTYNYPTEIIEFKEPITDTCSGKRFSLFLTSSGSLYFLGILHYDFVRSPQYITKNVTSMTAFYETYFVIKSNDIYINGFFKEKSYQKERVYSFKGIEENIISISASNDMFMISTQVNLPLETLNMRSKDIFFQFK